MYITITVEAEGKRFDISIDERQEVGSAIAILQERGFVSGIASRLRFKSLLHDVWIDSKTPFVTAGVCSGDLLTAQEK